MWGNSPELDAVWISHQLDLDMNIAEPFKQRLTQVS
jgi:hypothetical protein